MATHLENLERLRQNLETNVAKLRKTLQYWQTWEIEYSSLKEEIELSADEPTSDEMLAIATDQSFDIVDGKDIKTVLNYDRQPPYTRSQVISQLRGRIDTGQKNAATIQKQLAAAEDKLEKVLLVAEPMVEDDGGEQTVDIFEELDDDGNVVSSRVVDASKDREELRNVLEKNGLVDKPKKADQLPAHVLPKAKATEPAKAMAPATATVKKGKRVAFASDTSADSSEPRAPPLNKMHPTQKMHILDEHDNVIESKPLELVHPRPAMDIDEDAIHYLREASRNAQAIAPIVATFDIESDVDTDMEDPDLYTDEEENSENEYGMNGIGDEISADYRKEMEELMKKHAVAMENAGPTFDDEVLQKLEGAHRDAALVPKIRNEGQEEAAKKAHAKGVRFAEELYVSDAPKPASVQETKMEDEPAANPISEAILERGSGTSSASTKTSTARRPSKFKTSMSGASIPSQDVNELPRVKIASGAPPQIMTREETSLPERQKKVSRFKAAKMES